MPFIDVFQIMCSHTHYHKSRHMWIHQVVVNCEGSQQEITTRRRNVGVGDALLIV